MGGAYSMLRDRETCVETLVRSPEGRDHLEVLKEETTWKT
jgi:hypothetical protein